MNIKTLRFRSPAEKPPKPRLRCGGVLRCAQTALSCVVLPALLVSCGTNSYRDEDMATKARRVTQLRKEAEECLHEFLRSENDPNGVNLEALECYTDRHRQTTEIYPDPSLCPLCYANYGRGLKMLGFYYWTLREKYREQAEAAPQSARAELLSKVEQYDRKVDQYLRLALQQFEAYFRAGSPVDYRFYQWAMECAYLLEDYRRALRYLDLFRQNAPLTEDDKERVKRWELKFKKLLQRQELERYGEEFER